MLQLLHIIGPMITRAMQMAWFVSLMKANRKTTTDHEGIFKRVNGGSLFFAGVSDISPYILASCSVFSNTIANLSSLI